MRWIWLLIFLVGSKVHAFPSAVTHGYTTCVTCHFSPSGGGLLTSYGKFVAGELFGAFNTSDDALPWLTEPKEDNHFVAGILARGAQVYFNTPQNRRAQFNWMQTDLEMGYVKGDFIAMATAGFRGSAIKTDQHNTDLAVRSYYTGVSNLNYAVRVGKFFPDFGIRYYNHNVPTRKGLYWNHNDEPYILQTNYFTPEYDISLAYMQGAPETQLVDKVGFAGGFIVKTNTSRTGISRLEMSNSASSTNATSLFTQVGYFHKGYTLAEFVEKNTTTGSVDEKYHLGLFESGWEFTKGVIPYVGYTYSKNETQGITTTGVPIGLRFYPITHVEMIGQYARMNTEQAGAGGGSDAAFLMLNLFF